MAPHDETLPPNQEATKKLSPSLSQKKRESRAAADEIHCKRGRFNIQKRVNA